MKAWATKVVVNESLKFLRTKRQHELLQQDYNVMDEVDDNDLSVSDIPPDVLQQMLSRLPTGYRTVLNRMQESSGDCPFARHQKGQFGLSTAQGKKIC